MEYGEVYIKSFFVVELKCTHSLFGNITIGVEDRNFVITVCMYRPTHAWLLCVTRVGASQADDEE
jgi:hypothetical protein